MRTQKYGFWLMDSGKVLIFTMKDPPSVKIPLKICLLGLEILLIYGTKLTKRWKWVDMPDHLKGYSISITSSHQLGLFQKLVDKLD